MKLDHNEENNRVSVSDFQGLQCPIAPAKQSQLEMSLIGEFPEHIPYW
jgi:hypothetical protein